MFKTMSVGASVALVCLGWTSAATNGPSVALKEEQVTIEYNATLGDAVVRVEAECEESLSRVETRNPSSQLVLRTATDPYQGIATSGLKWESQETDLVSLRQLFPEGAYRFKARTSGGLAATGSAVLSHQILEPTELIYPQHGLLDVPATNLTVTWVADPQAAAYHVSLEQDENDGLIVKLPAGSSSLQVPSGALAPGRRAKLEVAAIAANGNATVVEILFRTQ